MSPMKTLALASLAAWSATLAIAQAPAQQAQPPTPAQAQTQQAQPTPPAQPTDATLDLIRRVGSTIAEIRGPVTGLLNEQNLQILGVAVVPSTAFAERLTAELIGRAALVESPDNPVAATRALLLGDAASLAQSMNMFYSQITGSAVVRDDVMPRLEAFAAQHGVSAQALFELEVVGLLVGAAQDHRALALQALRRYSPADDRLRVVRSFLLGQESYVQRYIAAAKGGTELVAAFDALLDTRFAAPIGPSHREAVIAITRNISTLTMDGVWRLISQTTPDQLDRVAQQQQAVREGGLPFDSPISEAFTGFQAQLDPGQWDYRERQGDLEAALGNAVLVADSRAVAQVENGLIQAEQFGWTDLDPQLARFIGISSLRYETPEAAEQAQAAFVDVIKVNRDRVNLGAQADARVSQVDIELRGDAISYMTGDHNFNQIKVCSVVAWGRVENTLYMLNALGPTGCAPGAEDLIRLLHGQIDRAVRGEPQP